eukprot:COSAG05_NODE_121_length_17719_cov_168.686266_12_plen_445_part_00
MSSGRERRAAARQEAQRSRRLQRAPTLKDLTSSVTGASPAKSAKSPPPVSAGNRDSSPTSPTRALPTRASAALRFNRNGWGEPSRGSWVVGSTPPFKEFTGDAKWAENLQITVASAHRFLVDMETGLKDGPVQLVREWERPRPHWEDKQEVFGDKGQAVEQAMAQARRRREAQKEGQPPPTNRKSLDGSWPQLIEKVAVAGGERAILAPLLSIDRLPGTLMVRVLGCRGLLPGDSNGLSDPFVKLSITERSGVSHDGSRQTKTRPRTLDPQFGETFYFSLTDAEGSTGEASNAYLRASVFDANRGSADELLGDLTIPLELELGGWHNGGNVDKAFPLGDSNRRQKPKGKAFREATARQRAGKDVYGFIQLRLEWTIDDGMRSQPPESTPPGTPKAGGEAATMRVRVPAGLSAGQTFQVKTADGRLLETRVPEGVSAGDEMTFWA